MTLADWRDLSIIWLSLLAFIINLVPAAIFFLIVKGLMALIRKLRIYFPIVYSYFRLADNIAEQASRKIAAPVIIAHEKSTQVRATGAALVATVKGRGEVAK